MTEIMPTTVDKKGPEVKSEERLHPNEGALAASADKAADVFAREKQEALQNLRTKIKAENPDMKDDEIEAFANSMVELLDKPELMPYMEGMIKRLNDLFTEVTKLRTEKGDPAALAKVVSFMEKELDKIDHDVKDEDTRGTLIAALNKVINFQQLQEANKAQSKQELKSAIADAIPFVGDYKAVREGIRGEKYNGGVGGGEKLGMAERAWKIAVGGTLLVVGVASLGTSEVPEGAVRGTTAITEGVQAGVVAKKGIELAARMTSLTSKLSQMPKLTKLAETTNRVAGLMLKYPKLAGVAKLSQEAFHIGHHAVELGHVAVKTQSRVEHHGVLEDAKSAMVTNSKAPRSDNDTAKAEKPAEDHGQLAA